MQIEHLIFDLDDTLYPSGNEMNKAISFNMINEVATFFKTSYENAVLLRKQNLPKFGSTLEWLMNEGFTDTEKYFSAVHPEDETKYLLPAPNLKPLLESFNIPMTILTNAPLEHAERVLDFFDVRHFFDSITDIRDCGLKGKPYPIAYKIALEKAGGTTENSLFIDDQLKYVLGFERVGGISAHVSDKGGFYQSNILPEILKQPSEKQGKTFEINTIYDIPELLKELSTL